MSGCFLFWFKIFDLSRLEEGMMAKFLIEGRLKSFVYGWQGLMFVFRTQPNVWIHAIVTSLVIICGVLFDITRGEWALLLLTIALVWGAEIMNTAFEQLCDVVSPEYSERVKHCKDVAAASVMVCAWIAVVIGGVVFWPYVLGGFIS